MTRKECLDAAAGCVLKDRNRDYGGPEDSFGLISSLWSAYLGVAVDRVDVAMMMGMLKMARIRGNKHYADGFVDLAGYAACAAECAGIKPKANEGSKFKPGDRVQYRVELPSVSDSLWRDATYLRPAFSWQQDGEHIVSSDDLGPVTVKDKDIRPAPKAEGCEELVRDIAGECRDCSGFRNGTVPEECEGCMKTVESDAPQTKEEVLERIRDVNPAIFKGFSE